MSFNSTAARKDTALAGCIFPILLGGLLLFMLGITAGYISGKENRQPADLPEPPLPEVEIPAGVPAAYDLLSSGAIRYEGMLTLNQSAFIVSGDKGTRLTIEFEELSSIKHLWSGSNARFVLTAPVKQYFNPSTQNDSWPEVILYEMDPFTPTLTQQFLAEPENFNTWLTVNASLDVTYPVPNGAFYTNETRHLEREFLIFVASEESILREAAPSEVGARGREAGS